MNLDFFQAKCEIVYFILLVTYIFIRQYGTSLIEKIENIENIHPWWVKFEKHTIYIKCNNITRYYITIIHYDVFLKYYTIIMSLTAQQHSTACNAQQHSTACNAS